MQRAPEKEARTVGALQTQADKTLRSAGSSWLLAHEGRCSCSGPARRCERSGEPGILS